MTAASLPFRSCELRDWSMVNLLPPGVVALGALLDGVEIVPAFGFHEGQPAAKAGPMGLLGHGMGEAHAGKPLIFKALAMPADEAIRERLGDGAPAGGVDIVPVLHVVRFGYAGGGGVAHHVMSLGILDVLGRVLVHRV